MALKLMSFQDEVALGYDPDTKEAGFLTKVQNNTGETSVKGKLLAYGTDGTPTTIDASLETSGYDVTSVIAESGITDGNKMWVWKPGYRCLIKLGTGITCSRGNVLIASDSEAGVAESLGTPPPPPTDATHFKEVGHALHTQSTAGGLVLAEFHTN
jgi:hypothetical protein